MLVTTYNHSLLEAAFRKRLSAEQSDKLGGRDGDRDDRVVEENRRRMSPATKLVRTYDLERRAV